MELPLIIKHLYTNTKSTWMLNIDENLIAPFVIQNWLCMNDRVRVQTRWLDKYVFTLPSKMYLSLAWSILPKTRKVPFYKFITKPKGAEVFDFILPAIRKHYEMSDNDFNANKSRIVEAIKNDMANWFSFYGVKKSKWKKHALDFNLMKKFEVKEKKVVNLSQWGM